MSSSFFVQHGNDAGCHMLATFSHALHLLAFSLDAITIFLTLSMRIDGRAVLIHVTATYES